MRLLLASLTAALTTSAAAPAGAATAAAAPQQLPTSSTARDTIVFARLGGDPENHDIWTMDGAGGHQRQLTSNSVADLEPTWSPDGSKIAWARWSDYPFNVGPADIWVMNADGTDQHPLTNLHDDINTPTWSPDGTRIAFTRNYRIWVINADGTGLHPVSPEGSFDFDPDWSPDGRKIAFSSRGAGSTFDLFTMRPNGTARHQLTHTTRVSEYDAAWSPDGRWIAYSADDQRTQWHVAVMPARASRGFVVVSKYSLSPDWSPDGRTLAFYACSSFCGMFTSPPWGRPLTPMPDQGLSDVMPEYRPLRSTS